MKKDAVTRQQYDNAYARYLGAKARYEQANSRRQSAASVRIMCRPISWVARVLVRVWLKPSSILPVSIFPILSLWLPVMV